MKPISDTEVKVKNEMAERKKEDASEGEGELPSKTNTQEFWEDAVTGWGNRRGAWLKHGGRKIYADTVFERDGEAIGGFTLDHALVEAKIFGLEGHQVTSALAARLPKHGSGISTVRPVLFTGFAQGCIN